MNHNKNIVALLFYALFTIAMRLPPIGATSSEESKSDHDEHDDPESMVKQDKISWNEYLRGCLVEVWDRNDPRTRGHAGRMHNDWSANFSQYATVSKNTLKRLARHFIEAWKVPMYTHEQVKRQEARCQFLTSQKRKILPPEFKADFDNFLAQYPNVHDKSPQMILHLFLTKYQQYNHIDQKSAIKYLRNLRWQRAMAAKGVPGKKEKRINYKRIPWGPKDLEELMDVWDRTIKNGSGSRHSGRLFREWSALHPEETQATASYLKRKADYLIMNDTKARIRNGEDNLVIRKRLEFMYRRGERIENLPGINENLLKFWKKFENNILTGEGRRSRGKSKITYPEHYYSDPIEYQAEEGSSSRTPYDHQAPPRSFNEDTNANSSQIPNPEADFQAHIDPHQLIYPQSSYAHYIQSAMFVPPLEISQNPQTHQILGQSQQKRSHYFHGESSRQRSRFCNKRPSNSTLNKQSGENRQKSRQSFDDKSEALSSRGSDDNLDLDLRL